MPSLRNFLGTIVTLQKGEENGRQCEVVCQFPESSLNRKRKTVNFNLNPNYTTERVRQCLMDIIENLMNVLDEDQLRHQCSCVGHVNSCQHNIPAP